MNQQTFTDVEYAYRRGTAKRETFLNTMDQLLPWSEWVEWVRPYYPSGKRGRKPRSIETMLRMFFLQYWYNLSTPATEDAINDSYAMRSFLHIDFINEAVPDTSTLLRFRRILKNDQLEDRILASMDEVLTNHKLQLHKGHIEDAAVTDSKTK